MAENVHEHHKEYICTVACYRSNMALIFRFQREITEVLDPNGAFQITPSELRSGNRIWQISKSNGVGPHLKRDGQSAWLLSFGSTAAQTDAPFAATEGFWSTEENNDFITVRVPNRFILQPRVRPRMFQSRVLQTKPPTFKLIEPIRELPGELPEDLSEDLPGEPTRDQSPKELLSALLKQINSIEANTDFRLKYSETLRKWVFTQTIE